MMSLWYLGTVTGMIRCTEKDNIEDALVKMAKVCDVDLKIESQEQKKSLEIYYCAGGSHHSIIAFQKLVELVVNSRGIEIVEEDNQ